MKWLYKEIDVVRFWAYRKKGEIYSVHPELRREGHSGI